MVFPRRARHACRQALFVQVVDGVVNVRRARDKFRPLAPDFAPDVRVAHGASVHGGDEVVRVAVFGHVGVVEDVGRLARNHPPEAVAAAERGGVYPPAVLHRRGEELFAQAVRVVVGERRAHAHLAHPRHAAAHRAVPLRRRQHARRDRALGTRVRVVVLRRLLHRGNACGRPPPPPAVKATNSVPFPPPPRSRARVPPRAPRLPSRGDAA